MNHNEEEVRAFIWLQQQFYKVGLLTTEQVTRLEGIDGWTWDVEETAPSPKTRRRLMRQIKNSYLSLDMLTLAQGRSFRRIFQNGVA
jgi:hypothetical protein